MRDCSWHPTLPLILTSSWDGSIGHWGYDPTGGASGTERSLLQRDDSDESAEEYENSGGITSRYHSLQDF